MAFSHPRLEVGKLIYPGPYALEAIEKEPSARHFPTGSLPDLKGMCCWCNASPIRKPMKRYCSHDCRDSAYLFCYPQSSPTKMYVLLQLQDCTCVGCGEIYDDQIREMVDRKWALIASRKQYGLWKDTEKVSLAMLGDCTGHLWHVDHIIPIFRGGRGVCIENVQVLCVKCHTRKSARERRT